MSYVRQDAARRLKACVVVPPPQTNIEAITSEDYVMKEVEPREPT